MNAPNIRFKKEGSWLLVVVDVGEITDHIVLIIIPQTLLLLSP